LVLFFQPRIQVEDCSTADVDVDDIADANPSTTVGRAKGRRQSLVRVYVDRFSNIPPPIQNI
jgi:hypothetical protein